MKYMKFCSLLVLSLLLFAPSAQAEVECTIGTNLQEIRMESGAEKVDGLTVTCTWAANDFGAVTAPTDVAAGDTAATGPMFNLELDFNGMVAENPLDEDMMPTLWLLDLDTANTDISTTDAAGNRNPAPMGEVSGSSVLWADVVFPASDDWDGTSASATGGESFTIGDLYVDASSVDNDRLKATIVLTSGTGSTGIDTEDESDVARIKQALNLELGNEQKAQKFDACEPGDKTISVKLVEGFRKAWKTSTMSNDISLMTSSGKISVIEANRVVNALEVTSEGGDDELIINVSDASNSKIDSDDLMIKFEPAMGGSGNITLSAMILPMRRTTETFIESAELIVGTFDACSGDSLFFPYVTSASGWYTGIAVINDSKVNGSCSLNWGNQDLDEDEMEALSSIDVDSKEYTVVDVNEMNSDYSGSLGMQCTFTGAYGFVFLSEGVQHIGQSYTVEGKP